MKEYTALHKPTNLADELEMKSQSDELAMDFSDHGLEKIDEDSQRNQSEFQSQAGDSPGIIDQFIRNTQNDMLALSRGQTLVSNNYRGQSIIDTRNTRKTIGRGTKLEELTERESEVSDGQQVIFKSADVNPESFIRLPSYLESQGMSFAEEDRLSKVSKS